MSSVVSNSFKQTNGYFVTVVSQPDTLLLKVATPATGAGGDAKPPTFQAATNLPSGVVTSNNVVVGTLLKDMGKTVVSSSRVFRKVQVVSSAGPHTNGNDVCYIELQTGVLAAGVLKVAYLPGLM